MDVISQNLILQQTLKQARSTSALNKIIIHKSLKDNNEVGGNKKRS